MLDYCHLRASFTFLFLFQTAKNNLNITVIEMSILKLHQTYFNMFPVLWGEKILYQFPSREGGTLTTLYITPYLVK